MESQTVAQLNHHASSSSSSQNKNLITLKPNTHKLIITGTLASTLAGLTYGSIHAVRHNLAPTAPALTTAFKTTPFGFAFFTLRQCVVDPLLSQTSAHSGSSSLDPASDGPTNRHLVGLLPTVITATILGGTINGFLRGRHTILRSALTKSLFCGSIHILLNEANLIRVRLLASSAASQAFVSHPPLSEDPPRFWEHWIPLERIPDQVWRERLTSEIESIEARRQIVSEDITRLEAVIKTSTSSNSSPEASRNAP